MYEEDTIAAIATPPGEGGIAIIRISGAEAENIATKIFARAQGKNGKLTSHRLYHGEIHDPKSNCMVDDVLLTIMRKPRSYTGEDVVEIHCHGGAFLSRKILGLALSQGARQAEPGEFTKRAFLNGKMDLSQAEAVLDLIRARTDKASELALTQARGELSKWVHGLREELLDILVQVEAAIDFPEEEIDLLKRPDVIQKIGNLRSEIFDIISTYEWGRLFREGARVCICGRPNVGKSSLLNALLGQERVIVTPVPGTTRDMIEEVINLDGLPVVLWDTAGLRETDDQIEQMGVNLSRQYLEKADALIVVLDGSTRLTQDDETLLCDVEGKKVLIAVNKNDLPQALSLEDFSRRDSSTIVRVSAKSGEGINVLQKKLRDLVIDCEREPAMVLTNLRHRNALLRGETALRHAETTLGEGYAAEFVAVDLNETRDALGEIIGTVSSEDILERIFSNFCIGK
ncbi:MAG TPA: tRNA uridine-5-carboxymethylaminomethyl(34) synthesis GTPase MnmE [Candidatus Binatia bacterium]|jgi:tRNA modification GTPase|nr:tRNA uridine-5-carboxymethylaminomethyl(34) synthesis GTPase MnmE [Candidatus Binatia bacterium]